MQDVVANFYTRTAVDAKCTVSGVLLIPSMTIYERLAVTAVSSSRVTDQRTLPGKLQDALPPQRWTAVDGTDAGCLALFVSTQPSGQGFRDNVAVIMTRFVFDSGVDPSDLIDHAYNDARALDGWQEQSVQRWPSRGRHSGWVLQTGRYPLGQDKLFAASTYVVHERGNVGYLMQTTATVRDAASESHADLIENFQTITFVD